MKFKLILSLSLLVSIVSKAQNVQYQTFSTPDVASLASEVKTPVSMTSGAVNVEIPLYTLKEGDIQVPISMSYDATGIRVGSVPGMTGQNWTLKAGGLITRVIKGAPDEARISGYLYQSSGNSTIGPYSPGYNWNGGLLNSSSWNTTAMVKDVASLVNGIDLEPDEFVFNFCGHSGSFYVDRSGQAVVIGQKGYKIEVVAHHDIPIYDGRKAIIENNHENGEAFTYRDLNTTFYCQLRQSKIIGIKITDPQGFEYFFGQFERWGTGEINHYEDNFTGIEITSTFFGQIYDEIFNTFYLMKIISPTKREVKFNYENGYATGTFNTSYTMSDMKVRDDGSSGWLSWFWRPGYMQVNDQEFSMDGSLIRPQVLKSIETNNYKIDFTSAISTALDYDYSGQIQGYLDYIAVNRYNPNIVSEWWYGLWPVSNIKIIPGSFISVNNHSNPNRLPVYGRTLLTSRLKREKLSEISVQWKNGGSNPIKFLFSYRENATDRLQLSSIQKKVGTETVPSYQFTYNNAKKLPPYLDPRTDHWGYYNGNASLGYSVSNFAGYHAFKAANPAYIDSEILLKIDYPTGGTKQFIYEPNKYSKVVTRNLSTGDLSIATVAETSGGGLRIKEIIEKPDLLSTSEHRIYTYIDGILNGESQYNWTNYSGRLLNNNTYTANRFFSNSILPVSSNSVGGSVSYSKVTETIPGNGKVERTYTNHDSYLDENAVASIDPQKSPYSPFSSRVAERGNLLKEEVFKENSLNPVSRKTYTYTSLNTANYIRSMQAKGYVLFDGNLTNAIEGSSYKIYTDPVSVASEMQEVYPDNSTIPFQTLTNYTYNSYFDVDTKEVVGSNEGSTTTYKTVYSYVHNTPASEIDESPNYDRSMDRTTLLNRNMVKLPIYISNYKNNTFDHRMKHRYGYSQFDFNRIFEKFVQKDFGGYPSLVSPDIFDLDKGGNPIGISEVNNAPTTYIWGYNYQFIVAEIKNGAWGPVNDALIELGTTIHAVSAANSPDISLINLLRNKLKSSEITTYTYDPLVGVKTATDPNGFVTYYNYDVLGRLSEIRDQNNKLVKSYEYHYNQ